MSGLGPPRDNSHSCLARLAWALVASAFLSRMPAQAQGVEGQVVNASRGMSAEALARTEMAQVVYMPDFFAIYRPINALEMVSRLPGFQLDEGDNLRGFGANAGNVLVNGERPSAKSTELSEFLRRIPSHRVQEIQLIRGATGALEARVQGVVANIVLLEAAPAGTSWQASADYDGGRVLPRGELAYSGRMGSTEYTVAAERFAVYSRNRGTEHLVSAINPERREETSTSEYAFWSAAFTTETPLSRERILRSNFRIYDEKVESDEDSYRTPEVGDPSRFIQDFDMDEIQLEASTDLETALGQDLAGKFVAIFNYEFDDGVSRLRVEEAGGGASESIFDFEDEKGESIARAELSWTRWQGHNIRFGAEGVWNTVDSEAVFTIDGQVVPIDGSDTRVTEFRYELFAIDSWSLNPRTIVDFGFAIEESTIRQSGDFSNRRSFTYPKPTLAVTHDVRGGGQFRLRFERDVSQLDFSDFVSSTNFDDNDIDFGNPELEPEQTWHLESTYEYRFGEIGVFSMTAFYDWIDDVEDLIPIGDMFESPGNIGDGRRWGGEVDLTATLDFPGLDNVRVEASARIQDSSVTDPVTGDDRRLSNEPPWSYAFDLRQDFKRAGAAWGISFSDSAREDYFGLDELVRTDVGMELAAFVETTRIPGMKAELRLANLLDKTFSRERTVFLGSRSLTPVLFEENRETQAGASLTLILSGAF